MGRWISGFIVPDDYDLYGTEARIENGKRIVATNNALWLTNIDHGKRHEPLALMSEAENIRFSKHSNVKDIGFQKYDNYDAIEVPKTEAIPSDYEGVMGVPITFLGKYNPDQFEILGCTESEGKGFSNGLWHDNSTVSQPVVGGQRVYKRIFIKHKKVNK
jgi:hypothetical protein